MSLKTIKLLNDFPGNNFKACSTLRFPQTKRSVPAPVPPKGAQRTKAQMIAAVVDGVRLADAARLEPLDLVCERDDAATFLEVGQLIFIPKQMRRLTTLSLVLSGM